MRSLLLRLMLVVLLKINFMLPQIISRPKFEYICEMPARKYSDSVESTVSSMYTGGSSTTKICSSLGMSMSTVRDMLRRNGVNLRPKKEVDILRAAPVDHNFFNSIVTEANAWCLGIMFSDGNVSSERDLMSITMADLDVLEKFKSSIQSQSPIRLVKSRKLNHKQLYRLDFTSSSIKSRLIELGCIPNKSLTVTYPELIDGMDRHFIRGVFDGDGCISVTKTGRRLFIIGTLDIVTVIGTKLPERIKFRISRDNSTKSAYTLRVSNTSYVDMYDYLYLGATIYMDRKYYKFKTYIG